MNRVRHSTTDAPWDHRWDDVWATGTAGMDAVARSMWEIAYEFWDDELGEPGRVLEAGCGIARQAARLEERGSICLGLDLSREGLAAALINRRVQGDVYRLPFPDAVFDLVFSGGLLEHFEDPEPVLREMARVLVPGGVLAATVIPKKHSAQSVVDAATTAMKGAWRLATLRWRDLPSVRRDFPFFESRHGPAEYAQWLGALGMTADIRPFGPFVSVPMGGERWARALRRAAPLAQRVNRSHNSLGFAWCPAFSIVARTRQ